VELHKDSDRVDRFIAAFEKLYGRKPRPEDAQGNFTVHVAQDMEMSVGGARYYIRAATEGKSRYVLSALSIVRGDPCFRLRLLERKTILSPRHHVL